MGEIINNIRNYITVKVKDSQKQTLPYVIEYLRIIT